MTAAKTRTGRSEAKTRVMRRERMLRGFPNALKRDLRPGSVPARCLSGILRLGQGKVCTLPDRSGYATVHMDTEDSHSGAVVGYHRARLVCSA